MSRSRDCALVSLLLCATLVLPAARASAVDNVASTTYQIDTTHDGIAGGDPTPPLKENWRVNFDNLVSYPVAVNGRVFVTVGTNGSGGSGSRVYAIDASTGHLLWGPVQMSGPGARAGIA